jgi:hypothetical protein
MEHDGHTQRVHARFEGREFVLESSDGLLSFRGDGFDVRFDPEDPAGTAEGEASAEVDLTYALIIDELRRSLLAPDAPVTYVNA